MIALENIINKIIEIDEKAVSIKQNAEEMLRNNEKELKNTLEQLEKKIMDDANEQADKQYNSILSEAKKSAERITVEGNEEYNKLDNAFSQIENELEEKIWSSLL